MKELSQIIKIYFLPPLKSGGASYEELAVLANNNVSFNEKLKKSAAGVAYDQSLRIYVDKFNGALLSDCIPSKNVAVELADEHDSYLWGDSNIPVLMTVTPTIDLFIVEFSRVYTKPLF